MAVAILLGSFLLLVLLEVPIAFCLAISALLTIAHLNLPMMVVFQKIYDGMDSFSLMAIPFFVLAGLIMSEGGMARRLVDFSNLIVGRVRGGLAMVNILASMFFGGISGSSVADTSSVGSILIPMMERKGYDREFAVCVTITSSTQGVIIPPSHNVIIYALAAGGTVSIAKLFMAGIIPGILVGLSLMAVALLMSIKRGYPKESAVPLRRALKITMDASLAVGAAVIIVGGVLSGLFTATESSAIAVVYAFLVTFFIYREATFKQFGTMLLNSVSTIAVVMFLIGASSAFGYMVALLQIPTMLTEALLGISDHWIVIMLLINIMLLLMGTIMDMAPLILITTPILLPVVTRIGIDPVHFGIIMMLNLGIGLCTPPVGSTLFVGCAVGRTTIARVTRSLWPFYIAMVVVLLLITYVPILTMWLPGMME